MKKANVLLVDDEALVLSGWKFSLESAGYRVKTALSGDDAISMIEDEKPDIVFTDLVMPRMNGVEVCRNIKAMHPDIEVVLVSGHPAEIDKHLMDFLKAGGKDVYLRKPLFKEEIIEAAGKIIKMKE